MRDVIIVGGGLAGLIAANRAAELGCSATVIEQGTEAHYLNNSRVATGALNFAHSSPDISVAELVASIESDTEGHADPALATALAEVAGRGLTWLGENGAQLIRRELQNKQSWVLAPVRRLSAGLDWLGKGADVLLTNLEANLIQRGGDLRRNARATGLITDGDDVVGVTATIDGMVESLPARAVILADGGFQGDQDLLRRYISPHPEALLQRNTQTGRGDGIRMAASLGARLVDMDRFYGHLQSRDALHNPRLCPYPTLDSLTGGSILINRAGHRQFDEGLGGILLSNLIAATDDPLGFSILFDAPIWSTTGLDEVVPANPTLTEAGGTLHRADTLDELAALLEVPAAILKATVSSYNDAIRAGAPLTPPRTPGRRFGVRRNSPDRTPPRPIETAPFYAALLCAGVTCTLGGIAIDPSTRVLREDGSVIKGLYAVGSNTGGIEGGPIAGYIGGLSKAYCTGLIAGEAIKSQALLF